MSDLVNPDFKGVRFQDEPRWLSWLQVQEQAVYLLDPETESEEELWARNVARNGIDESVYSYVDAIRAKNLLASDHGYYSQSTVDLAVDEQISGHDWVSSETISPRDGKQRDEFREQTNDLRDRPDENFFLGLPGLRAIETGIQDLYFKHNRECKKCHIYTPKGFVSCQNCE